jgi:hypothetical protein
MSILKIISNKSWGLDIDTHVLVYKSLIRSIMEYSAIIWPCLSKANAQALVSIQNNCLKFSEIIFTKINSSLSEDLIATQLVNAEPEAIGVPIRGRVYEKLMGFSNIDTTLVALQDEFLGFH